MVTDFRVVGLERCSRGLPQLEMASDDIETQRQHLLYVITATLHNACLYEGFDHALAHIGAFDGRQDINARSGRDDRMSCPFESSFYANIFWPELLCSDRSRDERNKNGIKCGNANSDTNGVSR